MTPPATVYLVTNQINGHNYVGVTRFTPQKRWAGHVQTARRIRRSHLHRAICKYGVEAFRLEAVASCLSREHSGAVERAVIQRLRPTYNQTNGGEVTIGRTLTAEAREKLRVRMTGRRQSDAQIQTHRANSTARWQNDASFRAVALAALERGRSLVNTEKRNAAVAASARGRVWSDQSRAKLSASCKGRVYSRDIIDRMREKKKKPVECIEWKVVFGSVSEAAAATGVSITSVSRVCLGQRNSANGLTFEFTQQSKGQ